MSKVSIIVPIFKVEKYLDRCVQSLMAQSLKDIEIILVDDLSPDNCPKMCDEYAKQDIRIKVVHKTENQGLGFARNSGLEVATGEYVTFCDSDDFIDLDTCEIAYNYAKQHNLDEVRYRFLRFNDAGQEYGGCYDTSLQIIEGREQIRRMALSIFDKPVDKSKYRNYPLGSSCIGLYRRDIIEENAIRFVSEREYISEDYIFNFQFLQYCLRIAFLPATFYHYFVNTNSLSQTLRLDRVERVASYSIYVEELIKQNGYRNQDSLYAMGYYVNMLRACSVPVFESKLQLMEKRKWFLAQVSSPYFLRVLHEYPFHRLSKKNQIILWGQKHKLFFFVYVLSRCFNRLRKQIS